MKGLLLFSSLFVFIVSAQAQCIPDFAVSTPGLHAPADTCFEQGVYEEVVWQFKNYDLLTQLGNVSIDSMQIDSINYLPCGLVWQTNKQSNRFQKNENGCLRVYGTTTSSVGEYTPIFYITAWIDGGSVGISQPGTVLGISPRIRVSNTVIVCDLATTQQTSACVRPDTSGVVVVADTCITPFQEDICYVTVDPLTNKNTVVWHYDLPGTNAIDEYQIFREDPLTGNFDLIVTKPNTDHVFVDTVPDPFVGNSRYRLLAIDTCGNYSTVPLPHRTMHLTATPDVTGPITLSWNAYEGYAYDSSYIYRGPRLDSMTLISTLASSMLTYTDQAPPNGEQYYRVLIPNLYNCNIWLDTVNVGAFPFGASQSNYASALSLIQGVGPISADLLVSVYPNPTEGSLVVGLGAVVPQATIAVTDILGKQVFFTELKGQSSIQIDIEGPQGIYLIHIEQGGHHSTTKLVKY